MTTARVLLFTLLFAAAAPAAGQYYPPPPPPSGPPPGPPPAYPPYAPPRSTRPPPRFVLPEPAPLSTARLQLGFTFVNDAYDCWYYGGGYYSCGYGYGGAAWPNLNAEVDIGLSHLIALTVGGNVFGGDWNGISNTVWEPHVDVTFRSSPYNDMRGRLRLGLGLMIANASQAGFDASKTGGAFRIGVGGSFFARNTVGLGLDAIFEAGSIGGYYVSTVQLMIGPELHF